MEKRAVEARPEPAPGQPYLMSARLTMPINPPKLSKGMINKVKQLLAEFNIPIRPLPTQVTTILPPTTTTSSYYYYYY